MKELNSDQAVKNMKCKANAIRLISRKICRNNCSEWDYVNMKCKQGFNPKPKHKK